MSDTEVQSAVDCPFPKRGEIPKYIRALDVGAHVHFPVGTNEMNVRSTASQLGRIMGRKFLTHRYEDGTMGVWREL